MKRIAPVCAVCPKTAYVFSRLCIDCLVKARARQPETETWNGGSFFSWVNPDEPRKPLFSARRYSRPRF